MRHSYARLTILFLLFASASFAGTSTWTGATSSDWQVAANWSGGIPGAGDVAVFDQSGSNRNITNVPAATLQQIIVSTTGAAVSYSFTSAAPVTVTLATGNTGDDLSVAANCELILYQNVSLSIGGDLTALIAGNMLMESTLIHNTTGAFVISGTFHMNGTLTISADRTISGTGTLLADASKTMTVTGAYKLYLQSNNTINGTLLLGAGVIWTMNNPAATYFLPSAGSVTGSGNMVHTSGTLTVDGLINNGGSFSNAAPLTGVGTITPLFFINSSTMFGHPGVPPGRIISGYTWRGLTSNAWTTASNWWGGAVPVSTGDAVIYNASNLPVISTAGQACRRLYIHNNDASLLTITPSGQLTASGKTTLGGGGGIGGVTKLLIQSGPSGTGSFIDNGTFEGLGVATIQLFVSYGTSGLWHYICVPMTQINAWTYFDQFLKYYSEPTHHFKYVVAPGVDSTLNSDGLGYALWPQFTDWTAVQSGIPNTGTMSIPVSRSYDTGTSDYDGWNLVGNPYASAVDLALLTGSWVNTDATAWFWDPLAGNYKVYPAGGGGSHTQYCPASQGFFVHCNDPSATPSTPGSGTVVMTNAARLHSGEAFLKESMADILKVNVSGSPNDYNDELSVYFNDALTIGYDAGFDALKMEGDQYAPQIYTVMADRKLAVDALPFDEETMVVPMAFTAGLPGSYMLVFSETESFAPNVGISLEDLSLNTVQDIRLEPVYTFIHNLTGDPDRFLIRFTNDALGTTPPVAGDPVKVFASGNTIIITKTGREVLAGNVYVFDMLGRTVATAALDHPSSARLEVTGNTGYYIVKVVLKESTTVGKVYICQE